MEVFSPNDVLGVGFQFINQRVTNDPKLKFIYKAGNICNSIVLNGFIILNVLVCIFGHTDEEKMYGYAMVISAIYTLPAQMLFQFQQDNIVQLFDDIEQLHQHSMLDISDLEIQEIIKNSNVNMKYMVKYYVNTCKVIGATYFVLTVAYGYFNNEPLFAFWTPFDHVHVLLVVIFQDTLILVLCFVTFAHFIIYLTAALFVSTQIKILGKKLQTNMDIGNRDLYLNHIQLIRVVKKFNKIYGLALAFQVLVSSGLLCLFIYQSVMADTLTQSISYCSDGIYYMIFAFVICLGGQWMSNASDELYRASYHNSWYLGSPKKRQIVLLQMVAALKPLDLHYRRLITFDMECFINILQATYPYYNFLVNLPNNS